MVSRLMLVLVATVFLAPGLRAAEAVPAAPAAAAAPPPTAPAPAPAAPAAPAPEDLAALTAKVVTGAVIVARTRLAANPQNGVGANLLEFVLSLNPKHEEAVSLQAAAGLGLEVSKPNQPIDEREYVTLLTTLAPRLENPKQTLLFLATAKLIQPDNEPARAALAKADRDGYDVSYPVLLKWQDPMVRKEVPPVVAAPPSPKPADDDTAAYVDYAGPLSQYMNRILNKNPEAPSGVTGDQLQAVARLCASGRKGTGTSAQAAAAAAKLCELLQTHLRKREDVLTRLANARKDRTAFRGDPKAEEFARQSREVRLTNVRRDWENYLKQVWQGDTVAALDKVTELQRELDQARPTSASPAIVIPPPPEPPPRPVSISVAGRSGMTPPAGGTTAALVPIPQGPATYHPLPSDQKADSPDDMKRVITEIGIWLEHQQQRVGGAIANRIYSENQNGNFILYLQASDLFQKQSRSIRQTTTEGIQRFWAQRCPAAEARYAHLVLVNAQGQIVGGSTDTDGTAVWVKP